MMVQNEAMRLSPAFAAGIVLGGFFFGGLWWTVQKMASARRAALWVSVSLIVRMVVVLTGFYFVGHGSWERLLACLLGFVVGRFVVLRMMGAARAT